MSVATRITALAQRIAAVMPRENAPFTQPGPLTVKANPGIRFPIQGGTFLIDSVMALVGTAPTGAAIIIDVNKGTGSGAPATIYATQGNRPTIAAGAVSATVGSNGGATVTTGDYLTVDVDQVGSTVAGADLVVHIRLKRTA